MKILTVDQMRRAEQDCAANGVSPAMLMENAGRAVAGEIRRLPGVIEKQNILVLVGPGNNGGDGLVAARYLHNWGARVSIYLLSSRRQDDVNFKLAQECGIAIIEATQDDNLKKVDGLLASVTIVLDAIFGTGKSRPLNGIFKGVLEKVSQVKAKRPSLRLIGLDLPSGLDADTGNVDPACPFVDYTITLGFPKVGLFNLPGAERAGRISIVDIGIPPGLVESVNVELISDDMVRSLLPQRPLVANKGSFGRVLVIAGSVNYIGAAFLACSGAIRVGAGLVTLAIQKSLQSILAAKLTEVTYIPLPETGQGSLSAQATRIICQEANRFDVLLMGCGLGQNQPAVRLVKSLLLRAGISLPLVLDADALNTLATVPEWWHRLTVDAILTPHPGEMARLTGLTIDSIQKSRLEIARKVAREWHKTVVLKGAYTVVAAPDGRIRVNPLANPGLASAGTGDVLSGAIAGIFGQGLSLFDAAICGVYIHGKAGDAVRDKLGDSGMLASDLLPVLPLVIKHLKEHQEEGNAAGN